MLFGVDSISVNRLPFQNMAGTDIDGIIGTISALEQMDVLARTGETMKVEYRISAPESILLISRSGALLSGSMIILI